MSLTINRNNEITRLLPELKRKYKTSQATTAIYKALDDNITNYEPEIKRLREIERKYREITAIIEQKLNLENQLKLKI